MNNMLINRRLMAVTVASPAGTDTWLGKTISSVQTSVKLEGGYATGTLAYVTGWTQFSGDPDEQEGNYLCVKITPPEGSTVSARFNGALSTPNWQTDPDGEFIFRITDKAAQSIDIKVVNGAKIFNAHYDLSKLTLNAKSQE